MNLEIQKNNFVGKRHEHLFEAVSSLKGTSYIVDYRLEQRGIADIIEDIVRNKYKGYDHLNFRDRSSKKSTEDFSLEYNDLLHFVDIKTHNINSEFCMPNLTAIYKIREIYNEPEIKIHYLFIEYVLEDNILIINKVRHAEPHQISWDSLSVANLGKGQLQIKNMHNLKLNFISDEKEWFKEFHKRVIDFKYRLMEKTFDSLDDWEKDLKLL